MVRQFSLRGMLMVWFPTRVTVNWFLRWLGITGTDARYVLELAYLGLRHFRVPVETLRVIPVLFPDDRLRAMRVPTLGAAWLRYGHPAPASGDDVDPLLDQFMPADDVAERHHIHVDAPAEITFAAACERELMALPLVRAIFKAREIVLGSEPDATTHPRGLLTLTKSIGWGVLAEVPGRDIVMGAVMQPWNANVVFRPLPPREFVAFREPEYVKIVWTLRADAISAHASISANFPPLIWLLVVSVWMIRRRETVASLSSRAA